MLVAGVDEAGRGPLAGPVFAAAVILPEHYDLPGLTDSKKLSPKRREQLFVAIRQQALTYSIQQASVAEIDQYNILNATLLAMKRALESLTLVPKKALIDGNKAPNTQIQTQTIIGGDLSVPEISAASILAKVSRDALLLALDQTYPQYGFAKHKGYGTRQHLDMLAKHGPCPSHRKSFAPIKKALAASEPGHVI